MISHNEKMNAVYDICRKVAKTDSTLLIYGETGTGKSLLANYIHENSNRRHRPLVQINCATLPEELFESELFGYVRGAFTGANDGGKTGLIESADGGTLFLDEIGTISLEAQAKLLQVLQERSFMPIGSNVKKHVNIRVIAATNEDLLQLVEKRAFREDLYYRLNVVDVMLPPLRERREDIILFIDAFLKEFNEIHQKSISITKECLDILLHFSWPGNIRQLRNVLERLVILCDTNITKHDLPPSVTNQLEEVPLVYGANTLQEALDNTTRLVVRQSFLTYETSRRVANDIGVSQSTAVRLIQEHCQDLIQKRKQSKVE